MPFLTLSRGRGENQSACQRRLKIGKGEASRILRQHGVFLELFGRNKTAAWQQFLPLRKAFGHVAKLQHSLPSIPTHCLPNQGYCPFRSLL